MIVMDDEKYFTFSHRTLTGMEPKILVWYAFSKYSVSTPIGTVKGQALDAGVYINVCSKWSNSSRSTTKMTKQPFGSIWHRKNMKRKRWNSWRRKKADNPPNVPQARPIEIFCSLGQKIESKNEAELCGRIKKKLIEIDVCVVQIQTMMRVV
jgi:hypothetical protein